MVAFAVYYDISPRMAHSVIGSAGQAVNANLQEKISIYGRKIDALPYFPGKGLIDVIIFLLDLIFVIVVICNIQIEL